MIAKHAKSIAEEWVIENASRMPGFCGAFFHGSINWLPDDAILSPTSDVDVILVFAGPNPPDKREKFIYRDVMLEISCLPEALFQSPEQVLGNYHLAGSFRTPGIILDPSGRLTKLQAAVSQEYAKRRWVCKRCEHAREHALRKLSSLDAAAPLHELAMGWIFGAGVMTHILLVAGLRNPTVRRRYAAVRELLADYGHLDFYETLLEMLGCVGMTRARAEHHLTALVDAFDAAKEVVRTPFPFASDISDVARPIAIDGSRQWIESGNHREAIFWIAVTYSRCQMILYHDAPEMRDRFTPGYRRLLGDLGIHSFADLQRRSEWIRKRLPRVWEVAEAIMAANPEIEG